MCRTASISKFKDRQLPPHDVRTIRQALVEEWQDLPQNSIVRLRQTNAETVFTLGVAIPAPNLTVNIVSLFERGYDLNRSDALVFLGVSLL